MKRKRSKPKPIIQPAVKSLKKARKITSDFHNVTRQVSPRACCDLPVVKSYLFPVHCLFVLSAKVNVRRHLFQTNFA